MTEVKRLVLHAFVCGNGCVEQRHYEGSIDLIKLVQLCPPHCRYAVVEWYGTYYVLDVKGDERQSVKTGRSYPDVDTAIMAAQLTY